MKKTFVLFLSVLILVIIFVFYQQKNSQTLKIGFLANWNYNSQTNKNTKDLLLKTVYHFNYIFRPDLVVVGGNYAQNQSSLKEILPVFEKIRDAKLYVLGNQENQKDNPIKEKIKEKSANSNFYYSQIFKNIRIIILDSNQNNSGENLGLVNKEQIEWLKEELKQPEPVLIFSHHSFLETPCRDDWQENIANSDELQELIKNYHKKIIAVFSQNETQDYIIKKSGVPYLAIGGFSNETTLGRFSEIIIDQDPENEDLIEIELKNQGKNSSTYKIKRNLKISTKTRIKNIEKEVDQKGKKWLDLEDENYSLGVLSDYPSGEPNLNITENGAVVVAYENKDQQDKIQVKIFKNNRWSSLADEKYPDGLISLGKGGNPRITTQGENIFVIFTELDYDRKIRLLKWNNENQKWEELSDKGFISDKPSHEATLVFDENNKALYVAYAEDINSFSKQNILKIKKWNGENWQDFPVPFSQLAQFSGSSLDEVELKISEIDGTVYLTYEEQTILQSKRNIVQVKKLVNSQWQDLNLDEVYLNQITQVDGFSPSLALDKQDNLYLSFIQNNQEKVHVYKFNQENWQNITPENQTGQSIEPFITINEKGVLYLGRSEFKEDAVIFKKSEENCIKTGAWRVRVQKYENDIWLDCEDEFNYNGYISKSSGKGDPALKTFNNDLFLVISDEENDYAARVKKYTD
jgi:flagellar motility protein MotE (MotC chaperone)